MFSAPRVQKLRWMCRRGMKELDVLLERFLSLEQESLEQGGWPDLERFLAEEDDRIWHWILHPESCTHYPELLNALRRRA